VHPAHGQLAALEVGRGHAAQDARTPRRVPARDRPFLRSTLLLTAQDIPFDLWEIEAVVGIEREEKTRKLENLGENQAYDLRPAMHKATCVRCRLVKSHVAFWWRINYCRPCAEEEEGMRSL
jgi:hypothetical protein